MVNISILKSTLTDKIQQRHPASKSPKLLIPLKQCSKQVHHLKLSLQKKLSTPIANATPHSTKLLLLRMLPTMSLLSLMPTQLLLHLMLPSLRPLSKHYNPNHKLPLTRHVLFASMFAQISVIILLLNAHSYKIILTVNQCTSKLCPPSMPS